MKKFQCYFEKLLKSKTVQLVTFIVKDYMLPVNSRETTFEHQRVPAARFNNISLITGGRNLQVAGCRSQVAGENFKYTRTVSTLK